MTLTLRVNGRTRRIASAPDTPLSHVLRNELKLKGTKLACGLEQCGACAVLVDGKPAMSCVSAVETFAGRDITTIEGLDADETGRRVQTAFIEASAAQCGYCTSGFVVAVTGLLAENAAPTRQEIVEALTPHLCRCGSHPRILRAALRAASPG